MPVDKAIETPVYWGPTEPSCLVHLTECKPLEASTVLTMTDVQLICHMELTQMVRCTDSRTGSKSLTGEGNHDGILNIICQMSNSMHLRQGTAAASHQSSRKA